MALGRVHIEVIDACSGSIKVFANVIRFEGVKIDYAAPCNSQYLTFIDSAGPALLWRDGLFANDIHSIDPSSLV